MAISVAVVEDDERVRKSLAGMIRRAPDCVCAGEYACGEEALPGILAMKPSVVVMDINLPGMSGVECARHIAEYNPPPQIIMLTVYQDTDTIYEALSAGASGYLLKPVRAEELLAALKDVFAGGAPLSSSIARKVVQSFQRPHPSPPDELHVLSGRERAVLDLLAQGYLYKEIGDQLGISLWTVSTYVHRIYQKLHVTGRIEALAKLRGDASRL